MANIGPFKKEIEYEPIDTPISEPAPATPAVVPQEAPVEPAVPVEEPVPA